MIPVSQLEKLFASDNVSPAAGKIPSVGGDYPEQYAGASEQTVYYNGGSSTLGDLNKRAQEAGPAGLLAGGARRALSRKRRQRRRRSLRRSNRKNRRSR